jgi:hypothetical protein
MKVIEIFHILYIYIEYQLVMFRLFFKIKYFFYVSTYFLLGSDLIKPLNKKNSAYGFAAQ